jgi:hypothetical protein
MSTTYETDQRLRSFLNTNQEKQEQMCLSILATDRRFSDLRPRHPRGGRDGGRDIQGQYKRDQSAFGAVGFIVNASDSREQKRKIKSKFVSDLVSALACHPKPKVFVFITNINLTVDEKRSLEKIAAEKGLLHCEVIDRERLRIALDSPEGYATRFQYLMIPLSESEQTTFFAKWGDDIHSMVTTGFDRVNSTLDRLLFLQEASFPLRSITLALLLDREYSADEIGHFRAFCPIYFKAPLYDTYSACLYA